MSCACLMMGERISRGARTARRYWGANTIAAIDIASYLNAKGTFFAEPSRLIGTYLRLFECLLPVAASGPAIFTALLESVSAQTL